MYVCIFIPRIIAKCVHVEMCVQVCPLPLISAPVCAMSSQSQSPTCDMNCPLTICKLRPQRQTSIREISDLRSQLQETLNLPHFLSTTSFSLALRHAKAP